MSVLNPLARELSAKVVFYGPGLSGKTSSLQYIHASLKPSHRGDLISLHTEGDRTLFFDFLPVHLEKIRGLDVRLQLYTVPGQVFYGATRALVLDGADGVVFVADSQRAARDRNVESLDDLKDNLQKAHRSLGSVPFVIQYNKRDLPDLMSIEEMRQDLNDYSVPDFPTVASTGEGVLDSLKTVIRLVSRSLAATPPPARRKDSGQRLSLDPAGIGIQGEPDGMASQVSHAIEAMGGSLKPPGTPLVDRVIAGLPGLPPGVENKEVQTIQAPAAATLSFASLWDDGERIAQVEQDIATGHFAEAVHRAASAVSELLDRLLGPHDPEGSGTRAQLLGLDGREYLELRRLAGRPASSVTQNEALFALYVLIAARIKLTRLQS